MRIMNGTKRPPTSGVSRLAFLILLILPVLLMAQTLFEKANPYPGGAPDAHAQKGSAWLFEDKTILRQASPIPYPDTLILVGSYETPGKARDVWVEYPVAYLANDHIGVELIDVSDPTNPTLVTTIETPGQAFDIMVRDTLVYVADDYSGFQILNGVGIVGGYDTPQIARGISVQGDYLYAADFESLLVFDISDPTDPQRVGGLALNELGGATARSIYVKGSHAYVGEPIPGSCIMWIVDVSDPASPSLAGWYLDPIYSVAPYGIYVEDSLAFVANYWNELFIVNVTDPTDPYRVSFAFPPIESWGFAWDVKVAGAYAYVANYDGGIWIVDVTNPSAPQTAAIFDTPGLASGVFVDSSHVYVADYYSLLIFEQNPNGVEESGLSLGTANYRLMQNSPNPFGHSTTIRYELGDLGHISLTVYDLAGRLVKTFVDGTRCAGVHHIVWHGEDEQGEYVPSGPYFCRLRTPSQSRAVKMMLLR